MKTKTACHTFSWCRCLHKYKYKYSPLDLLYLSHLILKRMGTRSQNQSNLIALDGVLQRTKLNFVYNALNNILSPNGMLWSILLSVVRVPEDEITFPIMWHFPLVNAPYSIYRSMSYFIPLLLDLVEWK